MDPFIKQEISAWGKDCKDYFASSQFPMYLVSLGTGEVTGTLVCPEQETIVKRLPWEDRDQSPSLVFADD